MFNCAMAEIEKMEWQYQLATTMSRSQDFSNRHAHTCADNSLVQRVSSAQMARLIVILNEEALESLPCTFLITDTSPSRWLISELLHSNSSETLGGGGARL